LISDVIHFRVPSFVLAAEASAGLDLLGILVQLIGGLALFLYGMDRMADALKAVAGDRMRAILARLTTNRIAGVFTGAFVTAVIQSSSVTTVLVVGFVSAGLMTMAQSVGVIMGANIGTTITAQIIAFKVTNAALVMVAVGFATTFFTKRLQRKRYGTILLGLGLVFLGMNVMGEGMRPLRSHEPFLAFMMELETPLLGIVAGAAFTALVQSSSATAGVVIVLATQGLVTLPAGIALILGANIGTCVTALFASIGKPREALRAAAVHVVFNVLGVALWLGFIGLLADWVATLGPTDDMPRQVANAHAIFNVTNTVVFLPLAGVFARLVHVLVPDRPDDGVYEVRAKYLDDELLTTPALALDRVRLEILHMGNRTKEMLAAILPTMLDGSRDQIQRVRDLDDPIDVLHGRIVQYLGRISQEELSAAQTADLVRLMEATNDLENIGDVIETNLADLALKRLELGVRISPSTRSVLRDFHAEVLRALDNALLAVTQTSAAAAHVVQGMKPDISRMAEAAAAHGALRLVAPEPHRLPAYQVEMDMFGNLKRIYYFAMRMTRVVMPPES
jgi:phosphate:Na+ symporter